MAEQLGQEPLNQEEIPEAVVDHERRVSLVWLIPLVALLAALWLSYHAYTGKGPLVTIRFDTAEGLEAGKTKVRFKDVDVGQVESIELTEDLAGVQVLARLQPQMARYLNDKARFWVARPRLSRGQISGLGTLVAGTYIAADFAQGKADTRRQFQGLETPPVVTATERGHVFTLLTPQLGSLAEGSPVLYRGVEVGRVVAYHLREDRDVAVQIFVQAPYDQRVDDATRFWSVSGIGINLDASGIQVNTGSLASVLLGGVAFGNPQQPGDGPALTQYKLYPDVNAAMVPQFKRREQWQVSFAGSVRGLKIGAPVELRGIRIGEVTAVALNVDAQQGTVDIPVTLTIEPGRLGLPENISEEMRHSFWDKMVRQGLRAQLNTGNLLTGSQFVALDFYPGSRSAAIDWQSSLPRMPSVPTLFDQLSVLLGKLSNASLDRVGTDMSQSLGELRGTLHSTNALLKRIDRETISELNQTLAKTGKTLDSLDKVLTPNSPLQLEAQRVLRELGTAARSLRVMADYLERHPEALIRGKQEQDR